jgi:hypothetical protein
VISSAAWCALLLTAGQPTGSRRADVWRHRAADAYEQCWFADHPVWMVGISAMAGAVVPDAEPVTAVGVGEPLGLALP